MQIMYTVTLTNIKQMSLNLLVTISVNVSLLANKKSKQELYSLIVIDK